MSCSVFWGSALVLFLAKWINLQNQETQDFWTEICEQILNGEFRCRERPWALKSHPDIIGLFCLTGIGLIPWRVVDTYRPSLLHGPLHILLTWVTGIIVIWYYKRRTRKLREKAGLPELYDNNDLPDPIFDPNYVHVLTDKQEYELHHRESVHSSTA